MIIVTLNKRFEDIRAIRYKKPEIFWNISMEDYIKVCFCRKWFLQLALQDNVVKNSIAVFLNNIY